MSDHRKKRNLKFEFWGWILFVICAGFFIASSIKNRDPFSLIGSIIFLIACLLFIIPSVTKSDKKKKDV
jgi:uncharacterized membrane protein